MGEEQPKEKKKPSSLRARVDRARKTYGRKTNVMPAIMAVAFLVIFAIGLHVALSGGGKKRRAAPGGGERAAQPGARAPEGSGAQESGRPPAAASEPKSVYEVVFYAKQKRRKDPDGALSMLQDGVRKFGEAPDLYHAMAMAVDEKMAKAGRGTARYRELAREKLAHLEKAMSLVESGKDWERDPLGNRTQNLRTSIEQARAAARR
jgi:hypothetical protein